MKGLPLEFGIGVRGPECFYDGAIRWSKKFSDSERDRQKKHHIFAPTADARCTIFPKLCMVIELVVPIIKGDIHFSIQRIVFPTGCMEKFGLIYRCAVSPVSPQ